MTRSKFGLQNIIYSILRKCFRRIALSSLPLISGDSYRLLCDVDLTNKELDLLMDLTASAPISVFLPISRSREIALWLNSNQLASTNWHLVLHNGDHSVTESDINSITKVFMRVSSVNWLGEVKNVSPIPIGLENLNYFRNGIKHHYTQSPKKVFRDWNEREFKVFLSIKEENNLKFRTGLESSLLFSTENLISDKFLNPSKYRSFVRSSQFVVSPPGNGADCHRTWEAIYLGAVPIVLREFWNFGDDLPVLIVDDYSEIEGAVSDFSKNFDYFDFEPIDVLFQSYIRDFFKDY